MTSTDTTYIPGLDLAQTYAAADASLAPAQIEATAARIVAAYRELVTDPAHHGEVAGTVPLRLVRLALADDPREYVDAALRWLDTQPAGQPVAEISYMDRPTAADMAAAVFTAVSDDETYMPNLLWFDVELNA